MPKSKPTAIDLAALPSAAPLMRKRVSRHAAVASPLPAPAKPAAPAPLPSVPAAASLGKQAQVLALLQRPAGATIAEMMVVTGWMSHSVRGLLSAGIKRKLGLEVISTVEPERGRVYRVAMSAPVIPPPHDLTPAKQTAKAKAPSPRLGRRRTVRDSASSDAGGAAG